MKKLLIITGIAALAALADGCSSTHVKTPEWEAKVTSHWLQRDVDKLSVQRLADGSYSVDLNGYKEDTSEQLPLFTKEMLAGIGVLGRLAGSVFNPAVASVPLTSEAAQADEVAKLVKANAEAKAQLAAAKAELAKARAELAGATTEQGCTDGKSSD